MNNKTLHTVSFALLVIGGLNWLLVGAFSTNVVEMIFGAGTTLTMVVYILVGLSAVHQLIARKGQSTM